MTPVFRPDRRLLAEAVASVRAQVYDPWELVLVDDFSIGQHDRGPPQLLLVSPQPLLLLLLPAHASAQELPLPAKAFRRGKKPPAKKKGYTYAVPFDDIFGLSQWGR